MALGSGAGRTVYGNGSYAPSKGQVSGPGAMGYVRRNLAQQAKKANTNGREGLAQGAMRVGNDGRSDTRSGVAQAAIMRQRVPGPSGGQQTPGTKPGVPAPGRPMGNGTPIMNMPHNHGDLPNGGVGAAPPAPGQPGPGTPVPAVKIGDNGQMELPYDANYNSEVYGDLNDFNNQLMQLQIGSQQQAAQYAQGMRNENQGFQQQNIADLGTNAGAGTAFSSRYATDVGHTYGAHQNAVNDLTSGNAQYNQQVSAQKAAIQDQFNQELQQAAAQRARDAAANAGNLGYGGKKKDSKGDGGQPGGNGNNGNGGKGGNKPKPHPVKQTPGTKPSGPRHVHVHVHEHAAPVPPPRRKGKK